VWQPREKHSRHHNNITVNNNTVQTIPAQEVVHAVTHHHPTTTTETNLNNNTGGGTNLIPTSIKTTGLATTVLHMGQPTNQQKQQEVPAQVPRTFDPKRNIFIDPRPNPKKDPEDPPTPPDFFPTSSRPETPSDVSWAEGLF